MMMFARNVAIISTTKITPKPPKVNVLSNAPRLSGVIGTPVYARYPASKPPATAMRIIFAALYTVFLPESLASVNFPVAYRSRE